MYLGLYLFVEYVPADGPLLGIEGERKLSGASQGHRFYPEKSIVYESVAILFSPSVPHPLKLCHPPDRVVRSKIILAEPMNPGYGGSGSAIHEIIMCNPN